jgi:hypothetical protein
MSSSTPQTTTISLKFFALHRKPRKPNHISGHDNGDGYRGLLQSRQQQLRQYEREREREREREKRERAFAEKGIPEVLELWRRSLEETTDGRTNGRKRRKEVQHL